MRVLLVALLLCVSCASPSAPVRIVSAPAVAPSVVVPHTEPTHATRSRQKPAEGRAGRVLSVTCYVATGNRTASGVWPKPGMAAGNRWPFGTRLRVQRYGVVTVTDRIGHGSELDLFFASRIDCINFGRQRLLVSVL